MIYTKSRRWRLIRQNKVTFVGLIRFFYIHSSSLRVPMSSPWWPGKVDRTNKGEHVSNIWSSTTRIPMTYKRRLYRTKIYICPSSNWIKLLLQPQKTYRSPPWFSTKCVQILVNPSDFHQFWWRFCRFFCGFIEIFTVFGDWFIPNFAAIFQWIFFHQFWWFFSGVFWWIT